MAQVYGRRLGRVESRRRVIGGKSGGSSGGRGGRWGTKGARAEAMGWQANGARRGNRKMDVQIPTRMLDGGEKARVVMVVVVMRVVRWVVIRVREREFVVRAGGPRVVRGWVRCLRRCQCQGIKLSVEGKRCEVVERNYYRIGW